jgi:hypothetical protein
MKSMGLSHDLAEGQPLFFLGFHGTVPPNGL